MLLGGPPGGRPQESVADWLTSVLVTVLFEGKSYAIFSFLFGLSFVLQWGSARRDGASEVQRSARRFAGLAVLGVLHGILLFAGDILLAYAVLGFVLLGLRRISDRTAIVIACALYAAMAALLLGAGMLAFLLEGGAGLEGLDPGTGATAAVGGAVPDDYTGGFSSYLGFQLAAYSTVLPSILLGQAPMALVAFLAGLVVGRRRGLERIVSGEIPLSRLLVPGLAAIVLGLVISAAAAWLRWGSLGAPGPAEDGSIAAELLSQALVIVGGPVQAYGVVVMALLVLRAPAMGWLLRMLAPAGRMSLTNYLGQSLLLAVAFSGLGLGLAGRVDPAQIGVGVVALWMLQLGASAAWMRVFRYGPLEAPLRAWTYRVRPRWR